MMLLMAFASMLAPVAVDPVTGAWFGASACQIRPSACTDETVVFHFERAGAGYRLKADKIVGGVEQPMGEIAMQFDPAHATLAGTSRDRAGRPSRWLFSIDGQRMSGRVFSPDGRLFRLIGLAKR